MSSALAVPYDYGAAFPLEMATAAAGLCRLVFVCDEAVPHVAECLPLLATIGTVVSSRGPVTEVAGKLEAEGVDGIVTFADHLQPLTARLAAMLGLPYHSPAVAELLVNKFRQRTRLRTAGMPTPRFAAIARGDDVTEAVSRVSLPAVLKPLRDGAGSRNTGLVRQPHEAAAMAARFFGAGERDLIIEELLAGDPSVAGREFGDYVSVESVTIDGQVEHIGISGKLPLEEPFRECGEFFPSNIDPAVAEAARSVTGRALRALGVRLGLSHTELKLTSTGPKIIEVNGRLGGGVHDMVLRSSGANIIRSAMALALGELSQVTTGVTAERIAYLIFIQPPMWARRVVRLPDATTVRAVPGVVRVGFLRKEGDAIAWESGTAGMTAVVHGSAPGYEELHSACARVWQAFQHSYAAT